MDEEGAHEEADADEEVERVDERPASLWTEGEHEEDAVSREEDSIASKLNNVMTNMVDVCLIIQSKHVNSGDFHSRSPGGTDKPRAGEDSA